MSQSLQDKYAPRSVCFGCGPSNPQGLRIKSFLEGDELVCDWTPQPHHHAFEDILNGGITGTLLDCHSNWAAAHAVMVRDRLSSPAPTVTAEFALKLLRPTPMSGPVHLTAKVVGLEGSRVTVESTLEAEGKSRAALRGTFVAVEKGHPAFGRWGG